MQSGEAVGLLGKPVEDLYGRSVGVLAGFSLKTNGDVESVGVDRGSGCFAEVPSSRVLAHDGALIVVPTWKANVIRATSEIGALEKRISALSELAEANEPAIAKQYLELRTQYEAREAKIRESGAKLLEEIRNRMAELDEQDQAVSKFLFNVNIQFRSGEISDVSFAAINGHCSSMKAKNAKEREELNMAAATLVQTGDAPKVEIPVPVPSASRE